MAAVVLSAGLAVAVTATSASASPKVDGTAADPVVDASFGVVGAMMRDLDLSHDEARARIARERGAAHTLQRLEPKLGSSYAGAWLTDQQELVVAVTNAASAEQVSAAGAVAELVEHSLSELDDLKAQLDGAATPDPDQVTSWRVDVPTNTVVVQARPGAGDAAAQFIASSGMAQQAVRIEVSDEVPELYNHVRGGDAYHFGGSRCSVGFSVVGGFVTAGHCGGVGTPTTGYNHVSQGTVAGSSFPGNDHGWVQINANWSTTPLVNRYSGSQTVTVNGSVEAPINASVCRSGSTTGWRCGVITHKNQTVNYPQGTVFGLTRTTACAQPGDSGGSFLAGDQAQGVTSGGSGNCTSGGITFFQPIWPILSAYNLTLITGSGGAPPQVTQFNCESGNSQFLCFVSYTSADPVTITWLVNGSPVSAWENQTSVFGGCNQSTTVQAVVSNQHGSDSSWVWGSCNPGPWM